MAKVIYVDAEDEIADVISAVRGAGSEAVALVLPEEAAVFQTPLNARLLQQFGSKNQQQISIVSGDPRMQSMGRSNGFPTYASVTAFERGIEVVKPHSDAAGHRAPSGGVALAEAPIEVEEETSLAGITTERQHVRTVGARPPMGPLHTPHGPNRKPLYFGLVAAGAIAFLLFLMLSPTAKVTITLTETPVSDHPTLTGSTDPTQAGKAGHIVTQVLSDNVQQSFQATPSGTKQVAAVTATATVTFATTTPQGDEFCLYPIGQATATPPFAGCQMVEGDFETADGTSTFGVTQVVHICVGPGGVPPATCQPGAQTSAQIAAQTPGTAANNAQLTKWHGQTCPTYCQGISFTQTTPSGGVDAATQTVVSDSDLSTWNNQVNTITTALQTQINSDFASKSSGKVIAKDPNGGGVTTVVTVNPPLPKSGDQFAAAQVTVSIQEKAAVYDPQSIKNAVIQDLTGQVPQGDVLDEQNLQLSPVTVQQAADDGTMTLSLSGTGYYHPQLNVTSLRDQLAGKSPGDVRNLIERSLGNGQVQDIQISQSPFPLFFMPFFSSRIQVIITYVVAAPSNQQATPGT